MDNGIRHGVSSSPNSAQGTDSRHGSPETKLTAFSPEDLRADQKPTNNHALRSNLPPVFSLSAVPAKASPKGKASRPDLTPQQHDPFVTGKTGLTAYSTSEPPKLSPTASAFTPMGFRDYKPGNIVSHMLIVPSNTSDGTADTHANVNRVSPSSAPVTSSGHLSLQRCPSSTTTSSSSVTSQPMSTPPQKPFFSGDENGTFHFSSTTGLSRALIISQVDRDVSNREFIELLKVRSLFDYPRSNTDQPSIPFILRFTSFHLEIYRATALSSSLSMTLETHAKLFLTFETFDVTGTCNTSETYQMDPG